MTKDVSDLELNRINELAKKSKTEEGLSVEEKEEQKALRQKYINSLRSSFTNQITSLKVIDPEGTDVTPEKVKRIKKQRQSMKDDK